jgi:hypothetical protein
MLHKNFDRAELRNPCGKYYDSNELKMFERVLSEIFSDLERIDPYMCAPENAHQTRSRIAVAIMAAAADGETNETRLKQAVIDRLF